MEAKKFNVYIVPWRPKTWRRLEDRAKPSKIKAR